MEQVAGGGGDYGGEGGVEEASVRQRRKREGGQAGMTQSVLESGGEGKVERVSQGLFSSSLRDEEAGRRRCRRGRRRLVDEDE